MVQHVVENSTLKWRLTLYVEVRDGRDRVIEWKDKSVQDFSTLKEVSTSLGKYQERHRGYGVGFKVMRI